MPQQTINIGAAGDDHTGDSLRATGTKLNAMFGELYAVGGALTPGGRLTLTTGKPVMPVDATAQSTVYYTPFVRAQLPIFDGTNWAQRLFTEMSLALNSTDNLSEHVYDIFVFDDSGTLRLGTGPSWRTASTVTITIATPGVVTWTGHGLTEGAPVIFSTTGALPTGLTAGTTYYVGKNVTANTFSVATSVANAAAGTYVATSGSQSGTHTASNASTQRGTGAGTSELELKDGIWTNKVSITLKAGGSTVGTPAANRATYLGSIYCTANGQTGMAMAPAAAAGGSAPYLYVYNAYNRAPITAICRDSTVSWSDTTASWHPNNAGATGSGSNNRAKWLDGLQQSFASATFIQNVNNSSGTTMYWACGVSLDASNGTPQSSSQHGFLNNHQGAGNAQASFAPQLGVHFAQEVFYTNNATATPAGTSFSTSVSAMYLTVMM